MGKRHKNKPNSSAQYKEYVLLCVTYDTNLRDTRVRLSRRGIWLGKANKCEVFLDSRPKGQLFDEKEGNAVCVKIQMHKTVKRKEHHKPRSQGLGAEWGPIPGSAL